MEHSEYTLHPTPQFARSNWIDLRGPWGFAFDDDDSGRREGWQDRADAFTREIMVPFPPESPASGVGDPSFHPIVWYRRAFELPVEDRDKRLMLHFGAVDYRAQVWVNGRLVASHEGGQTPFCADITEVLVPGAGQVITVRAEDRPEDLAQPRGKQDWREQPHEIWYHRTTGIWQPVWLEPVSPTHIAELQWTPNLARSSLGLSVTLQGHYGAGTVQLAVRLSLHGQPLADDLLTVYGREVRRDIALDPGRLAMEPRDILWSPSRPNLIDAAISVLVDGTVVDTVETYAGMREVGTEGGRFVLNGYACYLRMVLEQGFWPQTHLAAPSDEALRREVELAKSLGFNAVRIHQKVEDPRYLYWCDRLGLLVWGEMANAFVYSTDAAERLTREWLEVVRRDRSHPCVVTWVPINESWGVRMLRAGSAQGEFVQALYHLTRALDPTRPVIANDGWEYLRGDLCGIHDYTFQGEAIRARYSSKEAMARTIAGVQPSRHLIVLDALAEDVPIVLSEFGGISYRPESADVQWYGYGTVQGAAAYLAKYRELVSAALDCPPLAGFCYTQLSDSLQETNGLLTANREFKLDPVAVHSITSRQPRMGPGEPVDEDTHLLEQEGETTLAPPAAS